MTAGQLVAEALAAAGRHDAKDVAACEDLLDHLALAGPKLLEPEPLVESFLKPTGSFTRLIHKIAPPRWPAGITKPYYTDEPCCLADPCREVAPEFMPLAAPERESKLFGLFV